jgi:Calcineurin-like phosphoesterase
MKHLIRWLFPSVPLLIACGASAASQNDAALWRPRFATPAIVAVDSPPNRLFTAEVRASERAKDWSVTISNDLRGWKCSVVSANYRKINRGTEPGWLIEAAVPADASPELFSLVVSCNELRSVQPQAVSIAPSFTNDFYILHIADEQIVNDKHNNPSGQYYTSVGTVDEMLWMQEPVNLINPRFVVITGDQIDYNGALDGWNNWPNWGYKPSQHRKFTQQETLAIQKRLIAMYKASHKGYRVPYVSAPGNHDVPPTNKPLLGTEIKWHPLAVPLYESEFGQRTWSLRMGDFYVLMHDWTEQSLKTWAEADFAAAVKDPTVKYRMVAQHFTTDQAFVPATCDLMLIGHGHTAVTKQSSPYYIYEDGPAFKYGSTGFFNFRRANDGWTCDQTSAPRDVKKDVWRLFHDHGSPKTVRCNQPDPMNVAVESVTITNELPENFYDGRVRFVLPKGSYTIANGTILSEYECGHGSKTAVVVKVNIPAQGNVTVEAHPAKADVKTAALRQRTGASPF